MAGMVEGAAGRSSSFAWALPGASLAVFAAASLVLLGHRVEAPKASLEVSGKKVERLSFVQEDVPTRQTRIYDTLAMLSMPRAEPVAWSDAASADTSVRDVATVAGLPDRGVRTAAAEIAPRRASPIRPPARPVELASAAVMPRAARPGPVPSLVPGLTAAAADLTPGDATPATRGPIQVMGVALPGSQYLPSGGDAMRDLAALGRRTREMGANAGSAVGDAFSAATDAMAETVGLR